MSEIERVCPIIAGQKSFNATQEKAMPYLRKAHEDFSCRELRDLICKIPITDERRTKDCPYVFKDTQELKG